MSIGIGLGAFVDGMQRGYGIRRQIEQDKLQRQQLASDRAWQEEQRAFEREGMAETRERRQALKAIDRDAEAKFQQRVDAGETTPDQWETFWKDYALPRRVMEMTKGGDVEGAMKLKDWGESEAALKGGKLFSSALLKSQTGDYEGALADAIKAGKVKGYIDTGLEVVGQDPITDRSGAVVGYRLKMKDGDSEPIEQDIAVGDIPKLVSTYLNPENAWNSQLEAQKAKADKAGELETHEAKKKIDQKYANDPAKAYTTMQENLLKNDLDFADMPPEEQDRVVRERLAAGDAYAASKAGAAAPAPTDVAPAGASAAPAASPGKKVIVDTITGKPVPVSPQQAAPGLAPAPADSTAGISPAAASAPGIAPAARAPAPAAPTPRPMTRQDVIRDAADHMVQGGNPDMIAQRLMNAGVPEEEWPDQVRQAMRARAAQPAAGVPQAN